MKPVVLSLFALTTVLACPALAQEDLFELEQQAINEAIQRVESSVVRIETVGGLEKVGNVLFGAGPTTGLVVSEDGYIISSAFNFAQKPTSILIRLPDKTRAPAKLIATDHSRMLVLLKAQVPIKLTPARAVPEAEIAAGQYAIAVGRTFEGGRPNVSAGIVSAVKRIFGRAVQTDCKVSPANYGGPLCDLHGRVMGVLVPLSSRGSGQVSGVEWYDSGIGFAVPLEHVYKVLPQLKEGKDLHPGILGVNLKAGNKFADPAVLAAVRANSPAYRAGFKPGDKIVTVDGKPIVRQIQVKLNLGPRYAGETVRVAVLRGKERIEKELELIDKLEPYSRPFLGVLPLRVAAAKKEAAKKDDKEQPKEAEAEGPAEVGVRYVYPNSGAEGAGLEAGDRIVAVNGQDVKGSDGLREAVSALEAGGKVKLKVKRGDNNVEMEATLGALPETVPGDKLPPAIPGRKPFIGQRPAVGKQAVKIAEFQNDCILYVPDSYDPAIAHGIVIHLHEANALKTDKQADQLIARWKAHCEAHDLILVAPKSLDPLKWNPAKEVTFVAKCVEKVRDGYHIDDTRIVAHGYQAGAAMAYAVAFGQRELIRAVAAVDSRITGRPPEHNPVQPLAFYTTTAKKARVKPQLVQTDVKRLRDMKYPVTLIDLGEDGRNLNAKELEALVRWIDTLDRV